MSTESARRQGGKNEKERPETHELKRERECPTRSPCLEGRQYVGRRAPLGANDEDEAEFVEITLIEVSQLSGHILQAST